MRRKDREVTDLEEIKRIMDTCKVCHVAMMDKEGPYVVPLSYGYQVEENVLTLYFHSAKEGKKIELLRKNGRVCFEMCSEGQLFYGKVPCATGQCFSSVIGYGQASVIEEAEEKCRGLTILYAHQTGKTVRFTPQQADSVCVYKIVSSDFTGKRRTLPGQ